VLVHQATFGYRDKGHTILATSLPDRGALSEIVWETDLPGSVPPGTNWEPYLSGFMSKDFYIVSRTFNDTEADRGGMAFTHAILIPLERIKDVSDISAITEHLYSSPNRSTSIEPIEINLETDRPKPVASTNAKLVAAALISRKAAPTVWVGQEDFESIVFSIWPNLWEEARREFRFRLSFVPQDVTSKTPTLVCIPATLESRWTGHDIVKARSEESANTLSLSSKLILGEQDGAILKAYSEELGVQLEQLQLLPMLETALEIENQETRSLDDLLSWIRLVSKLSPSAGAGTTLKSKSVVELCKKIKKSKAQDILKLRNIETAAFSDGPLIWKELEAWAKRNAALQDSDFPRIVISASDDAPVTPWKDAIWSGLEEACSELDKNNAALIWTLWDTAPEILEKIFNKLPKRKKAETALAETTPNKLKKEVATPLLEKSRSNRWYRLHGAVCGATLPFKDAVEKQLSVDSEPLDKSGLKYCVRNAPEKDIISLAVTLQEERLISLCGDLCAKKPHLMKAADITNLTWQTIISIAIGKKRSAWKGLAPSHKFMCRLVDLLIQNQTLSEDLLASLAETPLSDLSNHPKRAEVWAVLPTNVSRQFLDNTSDGWLEQFKSDPNTAPNLESPLQESVLEQNRVALFLSNLKKGELTVGAKLFLRFKQLPERAFKHWVGLVLRQHSRLSIPEAEQIGAVISSKNWRSSAAVLYDEYRHRNRTDLTPALRECKDCLNIISSWWIFKLEGPSFPAPTGEQKWELLENTAIQLYPKGPEENSIWSRAGGQEENLGQHGSGKSRWHEAIRLLRYGGGGDISRKDLIKEMQNDFPRNDHLEWLANESSL